jgi:uncharacterized protein DUF3726
MTYSLNEVQAMAKRAARGAGLDWGMAEEAAWATRSLCRAGLPGVAILADLLADLDPDPAVGSLQDMQLPWRGHGGTLSPLRAGPALTDFAPLLQRTSISMRAVRQPAMLLPFAWAVSTQLAAQVAIRWDGGQARVGKAGLHLTGKIPEQGDVQIANLSPDQTVDLTPPGHSRADPDPKAWQLLGQWAHKTFAPASDASRLLGAGAGLSDND